MPDLKPCYTFFDYTIYYRLSELRTVRHSRDVRLRTESEQRDIGMRLLQRDVANLPPEATEQLRQAHHTLCEFKYLLHCSY